MNEGVLHIVGAGGFGREVAWLSRRAYGEQQSLVFLVDDPRYLVPEVDGIPVKLLDEALPGSPYVIAVGDPSARAALSGHCDQRGLVAATLVHPSVEKSNSVTIGDGGIVCCGSVMTVNVVIERHVHVNLNCTIGHDVRIGPFTTLSPGAHISGNVHIGAGVFVGTGAVVINGSAGAPLVIGDGAIIAAGACVTKPVQPGTLVAGVPAVIKK